jgi:hypothetical protein
LPSAVIPAKAGIQSLPLDSGSRVPRVRNDTRQHSPAFSFVAPRQAGGLNQYGTKTEPPEDHGSMRDFVLVDPTGVLWRIGENISGRGTR